MQRETVVLLFRLVSIFNFSMLTIYCCPRRQVAKITEPARNVFLSLDFVPYHELDELIGGADVGIAMYRPATVNWQLMGAASSKVAQYLKLGFPVIHNNSYSLRDMIDRFHRGLYAPNCNDIGKAAIEIDRRCEEYSNNAMRCFDEAFDYDIYAGQLLRTLEKRPTSGYAAEVLQRAGRRDNRRYQ